MSLRHRLDCLVVFVGMILLCLLPLLACRTLALSTALRLTSPSPNCFLSVCLPKLFAAALKDFLPLITSPISGAANSNMSAPMRFATRLELQFSQKLVQKPRIPFPSVFQPPYSMEFLLVLKQPSCSIVCVRNECWTPF